MFYQSRLFTGDILNTANGGFHQRVGEMVLAR